MVTIVRDRIREYVKRGLTLDQVKEKKPTLDFDPRYASRGRAERVHRGHLQGNGGRRRAAHAGERQMSARILERDTAEKDAATTRRVSTWAAWTAGAALCAAVIGMAGEARPSAQSAQGPQAGRGRGAAPTGPARQTAPVDLTGNWVSIVTEDWQWRMRTPAKGDYASVPLTPEGRKIADQWTSAQEGQVRPTVRAA